MLASPCLEYYSINNLNKLTRKSGPSLFICHCNTRSLSKNFDTLGEILNSLDSKPDILGITETKLNQFSISNLDLNNYNLFRTNSKTNAGGTALYISNTLRGIVTKSVPGQKSGGQPISFKLVPDIILGEILQNTIWFCFLAFG